ncbi:DUF1836 domain-containing protein [Bacillus infantis]|uniref:DUF1836 domain-containing protein n=1 Tax=Bacillus infantis TaxID=324767 RepID=UPI003CF6F2FA
MELFQLSRARMAELLFALRGEGEKNPKAVLQEAWKSGHLTNIYGKKLEIFIETDMPAIFEKIMRQNSPVPGFSVNEIVSLGNQIEYTNLSSTAVQNWVKREMRELVGTPQAGKKYTIDQTAILFIVEDLKSALDFGSIRKILTLLFNNPEDRTDDVIDPINFYAGYAGIFEKVHPQKLAEGTAHFQVEQEIRRESEAALEGFTDLTGSQKELVSNVLTTAVLTVLSAYYKTLTRKYVSATLFLNGE